MKTQSSSQKYEGECKFCSNEFTKRQIAHHLDECEKRQHRSIKNKPSLRLKITDTYAKNFWLIVEVSSSATWKELDHFIREVWVECCGHLSQFGDWNEKQMPMNKPVMNVLEPGEKVKYIYDFGTSTELMVEALNQHDFTLNPGKSIELVARNYLPMSNCLECEAQGAYVCTNCMVDGSAFFCKKCIQKHENKKEDCEGMSLRLANSPRAGQCGYEPMEELNSLFTS